jgi:glycine/D-amino acid oxidase-like deaminating enzyme
MGKNSADVVICGAGIAGIAAAYHLAVKAGIKDIALVDERPPLSLTSDKSTECYRNWWPGPGNAMVSLMNRSIDTLEALARESGNTFHLNRRGYVFATANPDRVDDFKAFAEEAASLGAGPVRFHAGDPNDPVYQPAPITGFEDQPTGSDLITNRELIRTHFPYLNEETVAVVHARRCGWFSAQQLGMYLLARAREGGVRLISAQVQSVDVVHDKVEAVHLGQGDGPAFLHTNHFVNVDLPVFSELHTKIAIQDHLGAYPRNAGLLIWSDPQHLPWSSEERKALADEENMRFMLQGFPQGAHGRSEGPDDSPIVLILWTYDTDPVQPSFPIEFDPYYPEIVLRGLGTMIPGMRRYFSKMPKPIIDGGYYTKTEENRPLVGPLPTKGAWIIGALSGFGLMAAAASGELLAAHITGSELPEYAPWFTLERYHDPDYQALLKAWTDTGQL